MMGEDIRFHSENSPKCRFVFLGKAAIYSAGTTFMSFFSTENRYLTRGTRLMIHERKLDKQLHVNGPLTTCVATVTAALHEIEASIAIQNEGFENLIRGSNVTIDEVLRRAPGNWLSRLTRPRPSSLLPRFCKVRAQVGQGVHLMRPLGGHRRNSHSSESVSLVSRIQSRKIRSGQNP
jgi:hypothetical protein